MKLAPNPLSRRLEIGLVVVSLLAIGALTLAALSPRGNPNAVSVRRGDISATVSATGKVRPKKTAKLSLPQSGTVATIGKVEGDDLSSGDVILSLKADDANRRVKQAELNVQNRQTDLARAKQSPNDIDVDIARANLQKATIVAAATDAAYAAAPSPQTDAARQNARADLDIARANFTRVTNGPTKEELDNLQNAVTAAQLDLDAARAALTQTKLTAPYTSTVTEIDVHEGELVGAFSQLAIVADLKSLEIAADIDEIDVAHAEVGQSVEVRFDAFPGESFQGKLTRLFPAASTLRGSTTYSAVVDFDPKGVNIRPGMGATLKIETVQKSLVLLVPNRALKNVGTRKAIHVVAPGDPRDVIVETGVSDGNDTEIVSGPLNEGDQITLQ